METKLGRPAVYSEEMADLICLRLSEGKSLKKSLSEIGVGAPSAATVFSWMKPDHPFLEKYARAKREGAEAMAEDIMDLSDGAIDVIRKGEEKKSGAYAQAIRVQVDTRKWLMSKLLPKKYSDHIDVTTAGEKLPVPLLNVIRNNDGSKEDIPTQ